MKNNTDYSNDSRLNVPLRQQICLNPRIDSFPGTRTENQPGMFRATFSIQPLKMKTESANYPVVSVLGVHGSILQTVKGAVRSFIFFNWKDHA